MPIPPWLSFANSAEHSAPDGILIPIVKERFRVEDLPKGFFVFDDKDLWVKFAVLEYIGGFIDNDGETLTEGKCIFYGEGPSGNLRECRHTYWGEDDSGGYIFYPHGQLIIAAFKRLSEFFDDMV
jgi:hypothetical protein